VRIETRALTRRFGRVEALRGVDLALPSGRRIGLVGPNGSGKSTLLRVLMGLLDHGGEVRVGGLDPRRQRLELAGRLAYVPQLAPGLAATVAELARTVERLRGLDLATLRARAAALGLRWEAIERVPFRGLSGGMRQKLLVALALASGADLIVLDEPTASLDAGTRETFFEMFGALPETTTSILCSHRLDEMRHLVDHVVCLEEGRVRFDGPAESYLRTRALSVIEAQIGAGEDGAWLAGLAFRPGHGGWWRRTVDQAAKVELLPRLAERLGGELVNLHVRDLESIAVEENGRDGEAR
jgi:ABC-2 type transport system ATP-binding protein